MTEAVILALIALVGLLLFSVMAIILVNMLLKSDPSHIKFYSGYGHLDVTFDTEADE